MAIVVIILTLAAELCRLQFDKLSLKQKFVYCSFQYIQMTEIWAYCNEMIGHIHSLRKKIDNIFKPFFDKI